MNEYEEIIARKIMNLLNPLCDELEISLKSSAYVTINVKDWNDIARFKYTERAKWLKFNMPIENVEKEKDNPVFANQKNKNEFMWKVLLRNIDDVDLYSQYLIDSYNAFGASKYTQE